MSAGATLLGVLGMKNAFGPREDRPAAPNSNNAYRQEPSVNQSESHYHLMGDEQSRLGDNDGFEPSVSQRPGPGSLQPSSSYSNLAHPLLGGHERSVVGRHAVADSSEDIYEVSGY